MNREAGILRARLSNRMNQIWVLAIVVAFATTVALVWPVHLQAQDSDNLDLSALTVTDQDGTTVNIGTFDPATKSYTTSVASTVTHVTIDASASAGSWANIYISPRDAKSGVGHQVELSHGTNLILVSVNSFSIEQELNTYSVAITKAGIAPDGAATNVGISGAVWAVEGSTVPFLLTRTGDTTQALTVPVDVSEEGEMLPHSLEGRMSVEFEAGYASARLDLSTNSDSRYEGTSQVEAALVDGDGYNVVSSANVAETMVFDNDYTRSVSSLYNLVLVDQNGEPIGIGGSEANKRTYSATVVSDIEWITVVATTNPNLSQPLVGILPADSRGNASGHQVDLTHGTNLITITVDPWDTRYAMGMYELEITRQGSASGDTTPTVSIYGLREVLEGRTLPFVLTRSGNTSQALTVAVDVAETGGDTVPSMSEGRFDVEFPAGYASVRYDLGTVADDYWEEHSTVTMSVEDGAGYDVGSTNASDSTFVEDDDVPDVTAAFTVNSSEVEEGSVVTANLTVTTDVPQQPHSYVGTLRFTTETGSAKEEDFEVDIDGIAGSKSYGVVGPGTYDGGPISFGVNKQAMQPVEADGVITEYRYQISIPIQITDDERPEADETFDMFLEWDSYHASKGEGTLYLDKGVNSHTITITISEHDDIPQSPNPVNPVTVVVSDSGSSGSTYEITWQDNEYCSRYWNSRDRRWERKYSAHIVAKEPAKEREDGHYSLGVITFIPLGSTDAENSQMTETQDPFPSFPAGFGQERFIQLFCGRNPTSDGRMVSEVVIPTTTINSVERPVQGTYSSEPALTGLTISPGTLGPAFQKQGFLYSVLDLQHENEQITLNATAKTGYSISWNPTTDADLDTDGHQVDLETGYNSIFVLVDHDQGAKSFLYEVIVKRPRASQQQSANTPATGQPTVSGEAKVGETLTVSTSAIDDEDGLTNVSYSYQWIRNDGSADSDISGATGSTYELADADQGKAIKVKVSFTDDANNQETLTSAPTAAAVAARANSPATGTPAISGTVQVGETLTADTSGITDADGLDNASFGYQWLADDADISGATGSTYTLLDADEGKAIKLRVFFTDDASNAETLTSAATAAVAGAPTPPIENLRAVIGEGAVKLTWEAPDDATVTGYRIDRRHSGEGRSAEQVLVEDTGSTDTGYTDKSAQKGVEYQYRVSARNEAGAGEASEWVNTEPAEESMTSEPMDAVTEEPNSPATGAPTISGTAQVGETLAVDVSGIADADGLDNATFAYQWLADDTDIAGATGSSYTLADTQEGKTIKVSVIFTDDAGNDEMLTSAATAVVEARPNSPATGAPTVTGTAQVGETLTASTSGISDSDGINNATFAYQWLADDMAISGATGSTYTLSDTEESKAIKVRVSFTDDGGNDETLASAATVAVSPSGQQAPEPTDRPHGLRAGVDAGTVVLNWNAPDDARNLAMYRILRHRPEEGESEPLVYVEYTHSRATSYTDSAVEPGTLYVYRVQAADFLGFVGEASAPASVQVPRFNSPAAGAPAISGTAQVGETLTANTSGIADTDGLSNASFSYQWLADDADISGATGSTYALEEADEGKAVKVRVSFTDDAGNAETLTSEATAAVAPVPLTVVLQDAPASHDGETPFTFELRFSEEPEPDFSYRTLRDHAFTVTGGAVTGARRLDPPGNIRWEITVRPDSDAGLTVVLPATGDCEAEGAVCTEDGRPLSNRTELTVPGPETEEEPQQQEQQASEPENNPATGAPAIGGTAQVGETLAVDVSGIADADGLDNATFAYQWLADDADISGANGSSYTLVDADEGKAIKVRVSFTDDASNSEELASDATEAVVAKPNSPATGEPTISGTAQVGETLSADTSGIADEDGLDDASFGYQWQADDADIAGATNSTYTLADADEGKAVKVRVSFTDDAGNEETLTSAPTAAVEAAPTPLTADFLDTPGSHDGQAAFTFELRFSENLSLSYKTLRDHAFTVSGGEVSNARRLEQGSNVRWEIKVKPDGDTGVTVVLPETTDCNAQGAICTGDGRKLSNRTELTVSGPGG